MNFTLKDGRGNDLRVGMNVIWPKDRSGTFMQEGEVIEIGQRKNKSYFFRDELQTYIRVRPKDGGVVRFIVRIDRVTVVV